MKLLFADQPDAGDKVSSREESDAVEQTTSLPTLASQLASGLLLISPFFFWGTSMVAMKVRFMPAKACLAQPAMDRAIAPSAAPCAVFKVHALS